MITAALTALLLAQPTPVEETAAPAPAAPVFPRSFGFDLGINGGTLGVEWQHGPVMGFLSFSAAISLISVATSGPATSSVGAVAGGIGYTLPLSHPAPSMWFMDLFGEVVPGWDQQPFRTTVNVGIGVGVGLRFLHESGFSFSIKVPVLGYAFGGDGELGPITPQPQGGATLFYAFSMLGTPMIAFGYRWDVR